MSTAPMTSKEEPSVADVKKPEPLGDTVREVAQALYEKSGGEGSLDDIDEALEDADSPYYADRASPCSKCDRRGRLRSGLYCSCEFGKKRQKRDTRTKKEVFDHGGLPRRLRRLSLDTWDAKASADEGKSTARTLVEEIIEEDEATGPNGVSRPGLLVHGPNGVGKSGLMAGLLKRKYEQGHSVLWIKWDDLIDDVQATYGNGGSEGFSTEALISTAQNTPLLFLDDLGEPFRPKSNYRVNEDARSITWRVLSARHEQEWPTFITSNHGGLSDISDQFSPRIADRLMELCTVAHMEGENLRHPSNQG